MKGKDLLKSPTGPKEGRKRDSATAESLKYIRRERGRRREKICIKGKKEGKIAAALLH